MSIEQKAIDTYLANMEYLKTKAPESYQKVLNFEMKLEHLSIQEKYALEYIDGDFDVQELKSDAFLYGKKTSYISQELAKSVNYRRDNNIFDGFPMFYNYEKSREEFDDKVAGLEGVYPLMTYYLDHTKEHDVMQSIEKFIFIGAGLGEHILLVDKKIHAEEYFIIEDDVELFRLSLFVTPYYTIEGSVTFSINENKDEFTRNFDTFLSNSFFRNKYLKYLYFNAHSEEKIKLIKYTLSSQNFTTFPYKTVLSKIMRTLDRITKKYNFINLATRFQESDISNKPVLLIAAGPSLSQNLPWIQKNKENFIIVAVSAVLHTLYKHNITPDIVTHLDGFNTSIKHLSWCQDKSYLQNSILLSGSFTPDAVLSYFTKENIYIYEEFETEYHKGFTSHCGPCVGSTTLMNLLTLNFKEIYLLGLDLAIAEDGTSHAKEHLLTKTIYKKEEMEKLSSSISFRGDFFKVKGNHLEVVSVNPLFYSSVKSLNNAMGILKEENQHICNLSNGAYIKHTTPATTTEIRKNLLPIDKKSLHAHIIKHFMPYTQDKLSDIDIESLHRRVIFAEQIEQAIANFQKSLKETNTKEQYLYHTFTLMLDILQPPTRENRNLIAIYDSYFSYAMPILFDFFNTPQCTQEKKHIKELSKIVINEMREILDIYKEGIDNFFKVTTTPQK